MLAYQHSYFREPPGPPSTNKPASSSSPSASGERLGPPYLGSTNLALAKPGLIVELCVPEEPEAARQLLSQLVKFLKQQGLFSKVDQLPEDLHRNVADPRVIIPDRHFVLALDFAENDFQSLSRSRKPPVPAPTGSPPKRGPRSAFSFEGLESPGVNNTP